MNLSKNVVEGLNNLGSTINSEISKKLIANAVKLTLYSDGSIPPNPEIYLTNPDSAKQSEYAVLTTLFLATKYAYDCQKLRAVLELHAISTVVVDEILKIYEVNRENLIIKSIKAGLSLPHVTDVEWKLNCDIKSSSSDSSFNEVSFMVNFGRYKEKTGERETIVEFLCNPEELQSLITKLKEIERHCEKISNGGK